MSVRVRLPGTLGEATGGATKVDGAGASLGEVVADLERRYPAFGGASSMRAARCRCM
ncbi:hypothetical protein BH18CHL2_BH18CHL2_06220 [soil metagenome]